MNKIINRSLVTAVLAVAMLSSGAAGAQPYQGGRGNYGPQGGGCYPGEQGFDCNQRMRAEHRSHRHYVYRDGRYEDSSGAAVAGILGFVLGAAIAGSASDRDYYNNHRNDYGWRNRCRSSYRSFNPDTGTYIGRDGYRHYCVR